MRCWPSPPRASSASWRCSAAPSPSVASAPAPSRPLVILATLNRSKGRELASLLDGIPFDIRLLADTPGARLPEETEATYRGNALLKARAAAQATGCTALADDSGLEVDALGGEPGVRSARFGGAGLDDGGRTALLLQRLAARPDIPRSARFRCVIA